MQHVALILVRHQKVASDGHLRRLETDLKFLHPGPSSFPFFSFDEKTRLSVKEDDPVRRAGESDRCPEEGEAERVEEGRDQEEMHGRRGARWREGVERCGREEGEREDVGDDFERKGERRGEGHGGKGRKQTGTRKVELTKQSPLPLLRPKVQHPQLQTRICTPRKRRTLEVLLGR